MYFKNAGTTMFTRAEVILPQILDWGAGGIRRLLDRPSGRLASQGFGLLGRRVVFHGEGIRDIPCQKRAQTLGQLTVAPVVEADRNAVKRFEHSLFLANAVCPPLGFTPADLVSEALISQTKGVDQVAREKGLGRVGRALAPIAKARRRFSSCLDAVDGRHMGGQPGLERRLIGVVAAVVLALPGSAVVLVVGDPSIPLRPRRGSPTTRHKEKQTEQHIRKPIHGFFPFLGCVYPNSNVSLCHRPVESTREYTTYLFLSIQKKTFQVFLLLLNEIQ